MKKEHIEFLKALKRELIEQPHDDNRDPRFWGVVEDYRVYGLRPEIGEGWVVYDKEKGTAVGDGNDVKSVIRALVKEYEFDEHLFDEADGYIEDIVELANAEVARKQRLRGCDEKFALDYYIQSYELARGPLFLTKKACKEYIRRYGYNYNNPRSYAMTADRCPEYETLLEIIKSTDWDAIAAEGSAKS